MAPPSTIIGYSLEHSMTVCVSVPMVMNHKAMKGVTMIFRPLCACVIHLWVIFTCHFFLFHRRSRCRRWRSRCVWQHGQSEEPAASQVQAENRLDVDPERHRRVPRPAQDGRRGSRQSHSHDQITDVSGGLSLSQEKVGQVSSVYYFIHVYVFSHVLCNLPLDTNLTILLATVHMEDKGRNNYVSLACWK